jgi:hypothetical protein
MFTPKRPDPPHLTTSKKAPEGVPVQRIGFRATRATGTNPADTADAAGTADSERCPDCPPADSQ